MSIAAVKTMRVGQVIRCGVSLIRRDKCEVTIRGVDLIVSRIEIKWVSAIYVAAFGKSSPGSKRSNSQIYWITYIGIIHSLSEVVTQTQTMNCLS